MSGRAERRAEGRRRQWLRELAAAYEDGCVLTASTDHASGDSRIRVAVRRGASGESQVLIERYYPTEWEHTIETAEQSFADLESTYAWLEAELAIEPSQLSCPEAVRSFRLTGYR